MRNDCLRRLFSECGWGNQNVSALEVLIMPMEESVSDAAGGEPSALKKKGNAPSYHKKTEEKEEHLCYSKKLFFP